MRISKNQPKRTTEHRPWQAVRNVFMGALVLFSLLGTLSCAPKQVYIPASERSALENHGKQGIEKGSTLPAVKEERREDGITEQDISGRTAERHRADVPQTSHLIKDIYFDFDTYTLRGEDISALNNFALWFKTNRRTLTVEGHCDERGSVEYNMALGQKRADAVHGHLLTLGIEKERIKTISYGKEVPSEPGHTEEAWAKNRRAHLKIE